MRASTPRPSSPRLSEVARHVVMPDGIVTTGWPRVEAKGAELGIVYDDWQKGAGRIALGRRDDGKYAATVGGVTWSIPRQVGKTFLVGSMLLILCALFPGLKVLWTAHRLRTSTMTFQSMQGMARRKKIAPLIAHIRTANGEQEIAFHNGSRILFGAREQGFGRGFDEIDIEVFDEAQILTEKALEDMVPATNQARHPHGALLFYIGTPPRPSDPGEVFTNRRTKAIGGKTHDAAYLEFSADEDAELDDRRQWAKANPSYPKRTPLESMLRMRENLGSDEAWRREALGIWDPLTSSTVFAPGAWENCSSDETFGGPIGALGLAVSVDSRHAAVVGAVQLGDQVVVKPLRYGAGTAWVVDELKVLQSQHRVPVVVDGKGPASPLLPHLKRRGVRHHVAVLEDVLNACAQIDTLVTERRLEHGHYPELDAAVAGAVKRPVIDRWAWGRRKSVVDVSPLEAASLAAWWASRPKQAAPPPPLPQAIEASDAPQHELATAGF